MSAIGIERGDIAIVAVRSGRGACVARRASCLAIAMLSAACASPRPTPRADSASQPTESVPATLERHYAAWQAARPARYAFEYRVDCFCIGGGRWYLVTVDSGRVTSATVSDSASGGKGGPLALEFVPTIDSLFVFARRAYAEKADSVAVELDTAIHHPTRLYIDRMVQAADDEVTYSVRALRPSPTGSR